MTSRRWMALFWTQEIQYINFYLCCCCCCCFSFLPFFFFFFFFRVSRVTNWPALTQGINGENSFDWNRENSRKVKSFPSRWIFILSFNFSTRQYRDKLFEKFYHYLSFCFLQLIQIYYLSLNLIYSYSLLILSYRALSLIYLFTLNNTIIHFRFIERYDLRRIKKKNQFKFRRFSLILPTHRNETSRVLSVSLRSLFVARSLG